MEAQAFTLDGILTPTPSTKRAFRVKWSLNPAQKEGERILAYGTGQSIVFRNIINWKTSKIHTTQILKDVTCVKYNNIGTYLAVGDAGGGVKILGWSEAENAYIVKWE